MRSALRHAEFRRYWAGSDGLLVSGTVLSAVSVYGVLRVRDLYLAPHVRRRSQ